MLILSVFFLNNNFDDSYFLSRSNTRYLSEDAKTRLTLEELRLRERNMQYSYRTLWLICFLAAVVGIVHMVRGEPNSPPNNHGTTHSAATWPTTGEQQIDETHRRLNTLINKNDISECTLLVAVPPLFHDPEFTRRATTGYRGVVVYLLQG